MLKSKSHTIFLKFNPLIIIGFLALILCFDFLDKIEMVYNIDFFKFNRYLKLLMSLYAVGFILTHLSYVFSKLRYLIYTILVLSLIFLLKYSYWILYKDEFLRYLFILVLYPVLHYSYFQANGFKLKEAFYKLMKVVISINMIAIIIGLIFNIEAFKTYEYGRFGYNGILLSQGMTPYFYLAAAVIFWTFRNNWMLAIVLLASAISGIKGAYFGLFVLIGLIVWFDTRLSKTVKTKIILCCFIVFVVLLIVIFATPTFRAVIENDGFISAVFSYRLDNLNELIEITPAKDFNILIGEVGIETVRLELQLIDVLLFFGIFGLIAYGYFMIALFKDVIRSNESKAFFFACLLLSLLSGNLLYIPLSMTLFVLTIFCLNVPALDSDKSSDHVVKS